MKVNVLCFNDFCIFNELRQYVVFEESDKLTNVCQKSLALEDLGDT